MPRQSTVVSIFLASPSDVASERAAIDRIIKQWNAIRGKEKNLVFDVIRWETNTSSARGLDAQDVINTQINDDYDAMIALFWTRLGTETARSDSGAVEEYERALDRHRAGEPIEIAVYFKVSPPVLNSLDPMQYQGVLDLKVRLNTDGVYYKEFTDDQTLDFEINILLDRLARTFAEGPVEPPVLSEPHVNSDADSNAGEEPRNEDAEEVGFLDVLESMEEHSEAAVAFLAGVTEKLDDITRITEGSARRIEELRTLGPVHPAEVKPLVAQVTDAYEQYSDYVEGGIDEYAMHSNGLAEDTRKLIDVSADFESSPQEVAAARASFQEFIDSMSAAIESMRGFADSVRSLQRMTVKFNHARRRLVANVDKLIDLISYSRSIVIEAVETLQA